MRPDETCSGCVLSHKKGNQWKCKLIDKISDLKRRKMRRLEACKWVESFEQLRERVLGLSFINWFWYACVTLEETTSVKVFDQGCIKCGDCCKGYVYQILNLFVDRKDPKTGMDSFMCKHLEYHLEFDNGTTDLGWRCGIFGKPERPEACVKFPTGHEDVPLELWLAEYTEIRNTSLPLCPARWRVLTEGIR